MAIQQNKSSASTRIGIGFSFLVFFGFILYLAWLIHLNYGDKENLISSGIPTSATIVGKACDDHGAIRYSFKVDGVEFSRKGYGCTLSCSAANIGDTIPVSYLPSDPSVNECGSLKAAASRALGWYIPVGLLVIFFSIFSLKLLAKGKPDSAGKNLKP